MFLKLKYIWGKCSVIKETQNKITMTYNFIPIKIAIIVKQTDRQTITRIDKDVEKLDCKKCQAFWKTVLQFLKMLDTVTI